MIGPVGGVGASGAANPVARSGAAKPAGDDFASSVTKALDDLDKLHSQTDQLASQAATGELESVTDYIVSATETQLATQVTVAIRNKAVEAFNDIMRMQI